ncbi:ATP-binding cassette domain-containing protein [Bradyrhizobium sp.]|jgi:branched-chain amino acid transport system ATP-binding protein|uniref:ABC transporter ATP-binding protein n=1 Tax=Bradyrhizobium sp. TaxID=376 RepID=UPI001E0E526F|nr:ATP-binding cassette domain-containing protein [Bradyrhizobium sp.]MBI5317834.1 ATP-binding cassette domain-containing protein [Bradyrhizobium sp.]
MLEVKDIDVAIGQVQVLRKVSISAPQGAMIGIIGRNGAGKTTLMRAIMGLLPVRAGGITFEGANLTCRPAHARAELAIGYAPEDRRLIPELTVEENLMIPAWSAGIRDADARLQDVYSLIPEAKEFRTRRAMQLSGGQQKLVSIARARMSGRKLLLLDEPFEGVAPALSKRIAEVVASLRPLGLSIVLSGADLQHAGRGLDRIYKLDRGEIVQ